MPVFNGAEYIGEALESVRREGAEGIEIIAADDGSTDGTLDVLQSYASQLPLRIVHRGGDGSWAAGANKAMAVAEGRFASILCHDDLWFPGRLSLLRRWATQSPSTALFIHPAFFVGPRGERLGRWRCPFPAREALLAPDVFLERLLVQNFIASPAPMFDRAAALESGGIDPQLWFTGDWDLWLRLATRGPVRFSPEPLAGFRIHASSLTVSRRRTTDELRWSMTSVLDRHLAALPATAERRRRIEKVASFSIELNVALAEAARERRWPPLQTAASLLRLGPGGVWRYFRDSRIVERVSARLRLARTGAKTP
jgi:hypothetical protein